MTFKYGVSIIVCCYNSAAKLPVTLQHIAGQEVPADISWEVIIVDNASTDNTAVEAGSLWKQIGATCPPFKVVSENTPGLSNARAKGTSVASYEFLLFCDDDNWLDQFYVANVYSIMSQDQLIGALGGCGIFEPERPVWSKAASYKAAFVNGPQTWVAEQDWVYGAGSVYRKSALDKLASEGWKHIITGRKGNKLLSGEDVEICYMLYLSGYKIIADEQLTFRHFVPLSRQNFDYIQKLTFWQSYSYVLLSGYHLLLDKNNISLEQSLKRYLWLSVKTLIRQVILFYFSNSSNKQITVEDKKRSLQSARGAVYCLLTQKKRVIEHYALLKGILKNNKSLIEGIDGYLAAK